MLFEDKQQVASKDLQERFLIVLNLKHKDDNKVGIGRSLGRNFIEDNKTICKDIVMENQRIIDEIILTEKNCLVFIG